jgi:uncharacterized membrane protein YcfT
MLTTSTTAPNRLEWVDYAKGICIILVVMMHSTLGVEKTFGQESYLGQIVEWAKPFRMPDFFLISGLFLARRIAAPWRSYADTKILHFAYFYFLWMTIQFLFKGYGIYMEQGASGLLREYALAFIEPFGTLWFIYVLAVFFTVTKLLRKVSPLLIFAVAAILEMLPINTGWIVIDEAAARYVYFFVGYWLASLVFWSANQLNRQSQAKVCAAILAWAAIHTAFVASGLSGFPGIGLALGFVGAGAVIIMGTLLARTKAAQPLRYLGANSIVIYLAFFFFMAAARTLLIKFAPWLGVDATAALVTTAGISGPVVLHLLVKNTPFKYLFVRPDAAKLESIAKGWHSASHDQPKKLGQPQTR